MSRTRVKIDGITRVADALAAADAGADAIGMVFHPPVKRNISIDLARQIVDALPPFVTPLGVFVDAPAEQIRSTCAALGVRHVQLHGHEPPELIAELAEFTIVKAIKVESGKFAHSLSWWNQKIASLRLLNLHGFVLETAGSAPGGTGKENNWAEIQTALRNAPQNRMPRLIAAGGLRPDNVAAVITSIRPYAVDISSGVEDEIGKKSIQKIGAFIAAVRGADESMRASQSVP